jgi:predicted esterase YcpF (UPF0227 family)
MQHLVYLHGFLSSPQSEKAQQTLRYAKINLPSLSIHMPQLPGNIDKALKIIDALVCTLPKQRVGFIGSSMGGFLATYCIEKYGGKAVLVNPAVEPYNLFADYLGLHVNPNTNERFCITPQHINTLKCIAPMRLVKPKNYLVMLQTGDETLDYRLAERKYKEANLLIETGGDHSFVNYQRHLPRIFEFLR